MSSSYAFTCQRAELLGLPPPTEEEWAKSQECEVADEDDIAEAIAEDAELKDEGLRRVAGGLDELNSILSATQKKINRFKESFEKFNAHNVCGSLRGMIGAKLGGSRPTTPNHNPLENPPAEGLKENEKILETEETITVKCTGSDRVGRPEIAEKIESHIDKLDSLINKAENAQYSMQHQTKEMRKILKK